MHVMPGTANGLIRRFATLRKVGHRRHYTMVLTVELWDGNNATPADFRRNLLDSHLSLAGPHIDEMFKRWWVRQTTRILAATLIGAWALFAMSSWFGAGPSWTSAAVSLATAAFGPWLALRVYLYQQLVLHTRSICETDLADAAARSHYLAGDLRGVIVVLKDESGAVCGSACMLVEDRANGINPIIGALGKGEGLITRVGVLPSHHGKGGGKMLVDELLALARAQRLRRVLLTTTSLQPVAIGLYSTRGFKIVKRNDRIPVLDFVEYVMALDL
jgi:GNAT superfamily N-acetyltransferase